MSFAVPRADKGCHSAPTHQTAAQVYVALTGSSPSPGMGPMAAARPAPRTVQYAVRPPLGALRPQLGAIGMARTWGGQSPNVAGLCRLQTAPMMRCHPPATYSGVHVATRAWTPQVAPINECGHQLLPATSVLSGFCSEDGKGEFDGTYEELSGSVASMDTTFGTDNSVRFGTSSHFSEGSVFDEEDIISSSQRFTSATSCTEWDREDMCYCSPMVDFLQQGSGEPRRSPRFPCDQRTEVVRSNLEFSSLPQTPRSADSMAKVAAEVEAEDTQDL
jgi:hypothetical protein